MPLPFNKNLDLKLLKLVKENPILYNTKHSKYLDFDSREVVWQKIGDALNRPALVCKSRWINIRDMMRRKVRDRLRNPNAHSYKYKYEDEISFMMPYFRESSSTSTTAEEYPEFLDEPCEVEMPSEVFVDETLDFDEPRETKPVFRKRQTDEVSANSSRDFSEQMFQELNPADPLDVFLLTIGSTLRKFSPYYLNQAKSKIFQVVQDYELQQIVNKDDQTPGSSSNR
ncbi:transcription factor Adf-1 [Spodoptera frugiperda]|uniref:Transcription factor Adf-1 n=1 Tax=Spodoptera frugiperda TaxID=7108 RepID=A0A9R0DJG4_SPOFR|nr:transcription factor Adf-1 [Spodoptera frugiperda]